MGVEGEKRKPVVRVAVDDLVVDGELDRNNPVRYAAVSDIKVPELGVARCPLCAWPCRLIMGRKLLGPVFICGCQGRRFEDLG